MDKQDRIKILELLLWLTDRPLKAADLLRVFEEDPLTEPDLREALGDLNKELEARSSPLHLVEVAQGFQLVSRAPFSPWVRRLFKDRTTLRLSPSALETLSIIAYKQPITRGEIEDIRGVDAGGVVDTLMDRKLVKMVGRKEALGRPLLYATTMEFMRQFGLKSLDELPKLEELVPPDDSPLPPSQDAAPDQTAAPPQEVSAEPVS